MALTDAAIDKIKSMILSGEWKPGDRLPREADLAHSLGLSRSSLREAVRALTLIHVLDVRHGDGTYVTSLDSSLLMDVMGFVVDFQRDDTVLDFLDVRKILEPEAAARAAVLMTPVDTEVLLSLLDEVEGETDVEALVAADLRFHRHIAIATGNKVLSSLLDSMSWPTQRARIWRGMADTEAVARTLREHRGIARGIVDRQPDVARAWATVHIAGVESWLRRAMQDERGLAAPYADGGG